MKKIFQCVAVMSVLFFTSGLGYSQEKDAGKAEICQKCSSNTGSVGAFCPLKGKSAACSSGGGSKSGWEWLKQKKKLYKKLKHGPYINTVVLENLLESPIPMVLIDARSGEWDDKSRIPGAKSLNSESTADEVKKIIKNKDTLVVTYCTSLKCPASNKLYIHLKKLGYKNVLEYPFGIQSWIKAGNDLEMAK